MNNNLLKLIAAAGLLILWLAALIAKHFYTDIDIGVFTATLMSMLTGLGVYHTTMADPTKPEDQSASPPAPPAV